MLNSLDQPLRLCVWWSIPCKAMLPVLDAALHLNGVECRVICANDLSESRKNLGWSKDEVGHIRYEVLSASTWRQDVARIMNEERNSFHLFNSHYNFPKLNEAIDLAIAQKTPYGLMTEAPINMASGWRWLAKAAYLKAGLRFRRVQARENARVTLCLSGSSVKSKESLMAAGWRSESIVSFGYFPQTDLSGFERTRNNQGDVWLFCSGLIERFKGHGVLIDALKTVHQEGYRNWRLHITGYGKERESLERRVSHYGMQAHVDFVGVLPQPQYKQLLVNSDVVVAPGFQEPWGMRVNEALIAGLPVIVSNGLGASEVIERSGAGGVFRSGNVMSLARQLRLVLAQRGVLQRWTGHVPAAQQQIDPREAAQFLVDTVRRARAGELPSAPKAEEIRRWRDQVA